MIALVQGASRGLGLAFVRALLERNDVGGVVATCRRPDDSVALRELADTHADRLTMAALDVTDEASITRAAEETRRRHDRLHLLLNCAGVLHEGDSVQPEKRLETVDGTALTRIFAVNAFGPLLVAKHFHPLLRHDERAVLANVSARVGSIEDNRSGGWYGYRASKAAQNQFTRTLAHELRRRAANCICVALHPGTVDTDLSRPFTRRVPAAKLFASDRAARQLLDVIDALQPEDSGSFRAWDGTPVPW